MLKQWLHVQGAQSWAQLGWMQPELSRQPARAARRSQQLWWDRTVPQVLSAGQSSCEVCCSQLSASCTPICAWLMSYVVHTPWMSQRQTCPGAAVAAGRAQVPEVLGVGSVCLSWLPCLSGGLCSRHCWQSPPAAPLERHRLCKPASACWAQEGGTTLRCLKWQEMPMVRKVNPTPGGRGDRGTVAALTFQFSFKGTCCISQTLKHVYFFFAKSPRSATVWQKAKPAAAISPAHLFCRHHRPGWKSLPWKAGARAVT